MAKEDVAARYFTVGTEVEVSNKEEGFRGSWYAATVVTPPTPPPPQPITIRTRYASSDDDDNNTACRKVTIEFKDLMEEEGSDKRLRETLDLVQIRPVPPRESRVEFKLNDAVDAFYNDGWWECVIMEVFGNGRFDVFFRATKELIEFSEENLRIHREWVYGEWIPPLRSDEMDETSVVSTDDKTSTGKRSNRSKASSGVKKSSKAAVSHKGSPALGKASKSPVPIDKSNRAIVKQSRTIVASEKPVKFVSADEKQTVNEKFVKGTAIEVKSDEDGFQGAWFDAEILEVLSKDKFLIEYKTLKTDDEKEFCREEVDIHHIRPVPPDIVKVDGYGMHEEVDALYNDGWWVGVISKVYPGSKYMVFFRGSNEELKFKHSDLRVHQEWIDGKWYMPSKVGRRDVNKSTKSECRCY